VNAPWIIVLVGAVVGIFVGIVGTSGAITIPVLVYVFGLTQLRAQGTALFIALTPLWILPLIPYWRAGNVDWRLGLMLAAGVAIGSYFGAEWAQRLPVPLIRKMFAVVLAVVAVRMFLQR
jgi:uncharacterized membrane protein YfcA